MPIHTDANGVVRVAGTRVTLDTLVGAFETGATAEEIASSTPRSPCRCVLGAPLLLAECSVEGEWEGQVLFLPL